MLEGIHAVSVCPRPSELTYRCSSTAALWLEEQACDHKVRAPHQDRREKNPLNDLHQIKNSPNVLLERINRPLEISLGPTTGEMKKSNLAEVSYTSVFQSHPEKYTFDLCSIQDITEKDTGVNEYGLKLSVFVDCLTSPGM